MGLMPAFLACQFGHHDPKRRYVRHDGADLVGQCRHCGRPIRRQAHRDWSVMSKEEAEQAALRINRG